MKRYIYLGVLLIIVFIVIVSISLFSCSQPSKPNQTPIPTSTRLSTIAPGNATEVEFKDPNLEAVIRKVINKPAGSIQQSDLEVLTSLDARYKGIHDLTGLEKCTQLTDIKLDNNNISNIAPLAGLVNTTSLSISHNQVSDISPLAKLTKLTNIRLSFNQIVDISALSDLTNLTALILSFNEINDISPLANLSNIVELLLSFNHISDISILSDLRNLRMLDLVSNEISDIEPLVNNAGMMATAAAGYPIQIYLNSNPLSEYSLNVCIPKLRDSQIEITRWK